MTTPGQRPTDYTVVKTVDGLYDTMLVSTFEEETGTFLHL